MAAASIITSIVTGGTNNHATVAEEANAYATDFITQGVLGTITNTAGIAPTTGSFGVNQNTGSDMAIRVLGTGATTNGQSTAYITCTPTSQDIQVLRARMSSNSTGYTINANSSGSTKYDWIYLQASATNAAVPDSAADNVVALYTSRSTSNTADNGAPPTFGILLAVVTVTNGATAITNTNIADKRTQLVFTSSGTLSVINLSNPNKFSAYRSGAWTPGNGSYGKVPFETVLFDTGSNFDTTNNRFVVSKSGFYSFTTTINAPASSGSAFAVQFYKNGSVFKQGNNIAPAGGGNQAVSSNSGLIQLSATDYVEVFFIGIGGVGGTGAIQTWFDGWMVSAT